jgi:undecaprenyl-diphosphatase
MLMMQVRSRLAAGETELFILLNQRLCSSHLDRALLLLTRLGSAGALISFCLVSLALGSDWRLLGIKASLALATSHTAGYLLKRLIARPRPFLALLQIRTLGRLWADYSFPSGHTTGFTAVALTITLHFPVLGAVFIPLILAVGFSRIYLGVHYPSDVMAGMLVGVAGTGLVHWLLFMG